MQIFSCRIKIKKNGTYVLWWEERVLRVIYHSLKVRMHDTEE